MDFPKLDHWGTPLEKLPDCPRCGADELGVIHVSLMICYACGWKMEKGEEDDGSRSTRQNGSSRSTATHEGL